MKKKISFVLTSVMLILSMAFPVSAAEITTTEEGTVIDEMVTASNYFNGSTGTMNSWYGADSAAWPISSPSMSVGNPAVTKVTVTVTKKSSSDNFYIFVESPEGTIEYKPVTGSGSYYFYTEFDNEDPEGTWYVWIKSYGGIATATARLRVDYTY